MKKYSTYGLYRACFSLLFYRLTPQQQDGFSPIAPDFVIELVSSSVLKNQRYEYLQTKMQEYLVNGVRLDWLIEPFTKTV